MQTMKRSIPPNSNVWRPVVEIFSDWNCKVRRIPILLQIMSEGSLKSFEKREYCNRTIYLSTITISLSNNNSQLSQFWRLLTRLLTLKSFAGSHSPFLGVGSQNRAILIVTAPWSERLHSSKNKKHYKRLRFSSNLNLLG